MAVLLLIRKVRSSFSDEIVALSNVQRKLFVILS
jgi:hypothetical protein